LAAASAGVPLESWQQRLLGLAAASAGVPWESWQQRLLGPAHSAEHSQVPVELEISKHWR